MAKTSWFSVDGQNVYELDFDAVVDLAVLATGCEVRAQGTSTVLATWTYSGSNRFLGLANSSGLSTPDNGRAVGDTASLSGLGVTTFYSVASAIPVPYLTTDQELAAVADAIRAKGATSALLVYPNGFVSAINAIPTGVTPTGTKSITISAAGTTTEDVTNYASAEITVPSGSAATPATAITANPTIFVGPTGLITASVSGSQSVTPSVSAGYVSSGTAGTVSVSGSNTQQLTTQAAQTITPTTSDQTIASGKYLTGTQTIKGDANLVAANIADGVTIFGVTGTHQGGGGGSSSYTLLYSTEITASTTSTTASLLQTIAGVTGVWTKDKIVYVRVRDKAGKRAGYFYGTDNFIMNVVAANGNPTTMVNVVSRLSTVFTSSRAFSTSTSKAGVYVDNINSNGDVRIYQLYKGNISGTINGTYTVDVYLLDTPNGNSPYA